MPTVVDESSHAFFFRSDWFATLTSDENVEIKLNSSDSRIIIRQGHVIYHGLQGTNILIKRLSYLDNGTYRCEVQETNVSSQPISEPVSIFIPLVLEVHLQPADDISLIHTFNDSQFVELGCDMSGYIYPDEDLHWRAQNGVTIDSATNSGTKYRISYHNGSKMAQFGGDTTIPSRVAVLTILDVRLADSGTYICAIHNTNVMNEVRLQVQPASSK